MNNLKQLRGSRTQDEVAKELGISRQYYNYIENGERTPSLKVAKKIAKYFRKSVDSIFFNN